jgi:hypothetical protein
VVAETAVLLVVEEAWAEEAPSVHLPSTPISTESKFLTLLKETLNVAFCVALEIG